MVSTAAADPVEDGDAHPVRHRWRRIVGAGVVLALLVVLGGGIGFGYWLTHPNAVLTYDGVGETGLLTVGTTYAQDSAIATRGSATQRITLDSVRPVVARNTANASITIELCRHRPGNISVGEELFRHTPRECTSVVPIDHQTVTINLISTQVIAVITPHQPGRVWIYGLRVSYHQGHRHQTQTSGSGFRWIARAAH